MIPVCEPLLDDRALANVTKAVRSGWISSKGRFPDGEAPPDEQAWTVVGVGQADP